MLIINIVRCKIMISFGFIFLVCILPLALGNGITMQICSSCLIHEFGHLVAIILCNKRIIGLRFTSCGINIDCQSSEMEDVQVLVISAAGCFANLLSAALLFDINTNIAYANIALGAYSMLPNPNFDGYTILKLIFKKPKILYYVGIALYITSMIIIAIYISVSNALLLLIIIYIMILSLVGED